MSFLEIARAGVGVGGREVGRAQQHDKDLVAGDEFQSNI